MARSVLYDKYSEEAWYDELIGYLQFRFHPIEDRFTETFRFVSLHAKNSLSFSYEYSSLLTDIGGVFASVLDEFVRNTQIVQGDLNISHYKSFLKNEVKDIHLIGAELRSPIIQRMVFPFQQWADDKGKLPWWDAYTAIKHRDSRNVQRGCLSSVVYALTSLAVLYTVMDKNRGAERKLFQIGTFRDVKEDVMFSYLPEVQKEESQV